MTASIDPHPPASGGSGSSNEATAPVVGVFDSGVGGLSVLPALRAALPQARLIYVADSGHAPYGERDDDWLQARCAVMAHFLRERGADLMVMACNTATAAAAPGLRARHPGWPIVGIEPGVKPAVKQSRTGRVGVMATRSTLSSQRYARLLQEHGQGAQVVAQACTGLAMAIERGDLPLIARLVAEHTQPLRDAGVDTLVLGCTHYPFALPWIGAAMGPSVTLIDTAQAVARRAASLILASAKSPRPDQKAQHTGRAPCADEFWTSGDPEALQNFAQRWLGWSIRPQQLLGAAVGPGATTTDR